MDPRHTTANVKIPLVSQSEQDSGTFAHERGCVGKRMAPHSHSVQAQCPPNKCLEVYFSPKSTDDEFQGESWEL